MGDSEWASRIGAVSAEGIYPLKQNGSPHITESDLLHGAPVRCKARMSRRMSPSDPKLREEALFQGGGGWFEGLYELSRDAVLTKQRESLCRSPAFWCGVPPGENLRAAGDLKQSSTNRATQVLRPINLPAWQHFSSAIKDIMAERVSIPEGGTQCGLQAAASGYR